MPRPHQGGGEQGLVHAEPAVDGGGGVPAAQVVVIVVQHLVQRETLGPGQAQGGGAADGLADADVERERSTEDWRRSRLHRPVAALQHIERPSHQGAMSSSRGILMPITTTCKATDTSMPNSPTSMESSISCASPRSRSKRLRMRPWGTLSKKAMGRG